jgi:hypothetical protein
MTLPASTKRFLAVILAKLWVLGVPLAMLGVIYYGLSLISPLIAWLGVACVAAVMLIEDRRYLLAAIRYPFRERRGPL